jgi:signal transduction histidine kinase
MFIYLTSFILSKRITNPIRKLTRSTEQLSAGDFHLHINIDSKDEIGELANRFTQMALRIKEQIEIIESDRDALKEAQLQSKTFFDNVTHELKTPLTTILGYAQVMKDNGFHDKDFFEKGTSYIIKESQRLNQMVIEIIELSKASSNGIGYYFERVDLSVLIKETCDEMRLKGKKYSISIHCEVADHLFMNGDRNKLKEVLINLIDNSIKYSRVNSIIRVEAIQEETTITLKVIDQGEGIPDKYLNNIFEPFFRIQKKDIREKGSAGLGLSIVKSIVDKHGGIIEIKSKLNEGTEVNISFKGELHA